MACINSKQQFKDNYETYVTSVMRPFIEKGVDSVKAYEFAKCLVDRIHEIDPDFFSKNVATDYEELNRLVDTHKDDIMSRCRCKLNDANMSTK